MMSLLFVAAQLADLATYHPSREANPLVLALGHYAPPVKGLLVIAVLLLLPYMGRWGRWVLAVGIVVGLVGAATNVLSFA